MFAKSYVECFRNVTTAYNKKEAICIRSYVELVLCQTKILLLYITARALIYCLRSQVSSGLSQLISVVPNQDIASSYDYQSLLELLSPVSAGLAVRWLC